MLCLSEQYFLHEKLSHTEGEALFLRRQPGVAQRGQVAQGTIYNAPP